MDRDNLATLMYLSPPTYQHKIHLLLDFSSVEQFTDVPNPYLYPDGFVLIYDLIYNAVGQFLIQLPGLHQI